MKMIHFNNWSILNKIKLSLNNIYNMFICFFSTELFISCCIFCFEQPGHIFCGKIQFIFFKFHISLILKKYLKNFFEIF